MNPIKENALRRYLAVRNGEHVGISPLTSKKVQPRKDIAAGHHYFISNIHPLLKTLLFCVTRIGSAF